MNSCIAQTRFLLKLAEKVMAGLDDSHRALEPKPGVKTAGWLVGHLTVTGDFARRLCGRKPLAPKEWRAMFNPGTQPSHDATTYPPMTELIAMFRAVYTDLCDAAATADAATLAAPNSYEPARPDYPTAADFVPYLISGHLGYHLGQLVAWRGAAGLGRV